MLYLVALLLPPLAVLLCGRPLQAILSVVLTIAGWIPGQIHALFVVHNYYEDRRTERIIKAMQEH